MKQNNTLKRPEFTEREEEEICYQIGEWYIDWKYNLIDKETKESNFKKAFDDLNIKIFPPSINLSSDKRIYIYSILEKWYVMWKNCIISTNRYSHRLGYAKEKLKDMLCDIDPLTGEKNAK